MNPSPDERVTAMLRAIREGDSRAAEDLLPVVYEQLRSLASARMRALAPRQTLQPTALVHEVYLRLVGRSPEDGWESRGHFFFAAARAMRDILVEQARRKASLKRGGDRARVSAEQIEIPFETPAPDMLALSAALDRLERDHPRPYQVVMLRFFGGLTAAQAAEALGVSLRTAESDWRLARALLHRELGEEPVEGGGP
ncbi:MAG: ECF-type sigma factor [Phycisphaerales bacterium JB039]